MLSPCYVLRATLSLFYMLSTVLSTLHRLSTQVSKGKSFAGPHGGALVAGPGGNLGFLS